MLDLQGVYTNVHANWEFWTCAQLDKHLRPDDVFLDVGANSGEISKHIRKQGFKGTIISVEPNPLLTAKLISEVPDPHVVIQAAAYAHSGELHRFQMLAVEDGKCNLGQGSIMIADPINTFSLLVPTVALSDLVDFKPTVMKMDIEGAEAFALPGAALLLSELRIALVEMHHSMLDSMPVTVDDLCALMEGYGLQRKDHSLDAAGNPSMYLFMRASIVA